MKLDGNKAIDQISNEIGGAIQEIAKQLGVAAEKVYPILYKQALIDGIMGLFAITLMVGFLIFSTKMTRVYYKAGEDSKDWVSDSWFEALLFNTKGGWMHGILVIGLVIVSIGSVIAIPIIATEVVTAFFNTDYYIMKDVLEKLR